MFVQCVSRVLLAHQLSCMGVVLKCFGEREHHGVANGEADLGDLTHIRDSVRHQRDSSVSCTAFVKVPPHGKWGLGLARLTGMVVQMQGRARQWRGSGEGKRAARIFAILLLLFSRT